MMKIIFLEPKNVLNTISYIRKRMKENNGIYNADFERSFDINNMKILKNIILTTNTKIVLYTQSRCCVSKISEILHELKRVGLDSYWIDTVSKDDRITKYQALQQWIKEHSFLNIEKYCIIDNKCNKDTPENANFTFWADKINGLTKDISIQIIDFFNNQNI